MTLQGAPCWRTSQPTAGSSSSGRRSRVALVTEFRAFEEKIGSVDAKIGSLRTDVAAEIGSLRVEMEAKFRRSLQWTVGTMIALAMVISTLVVVFR